MRALRPLPPKFLAAVVAVLPLPGSPLYAGDDRRIMDQALADLEAYRKAGVESIVFENDHDLPYVQPPLDKRGIALMTRIAKAARERFEDAAAAVRTAMRPSRSPMASAALMRRLRKTCWTWDESLLMGGRPSSAFTSILMLWNFAWCWRMLIAFWRAS